MGYAKADRSYYAEECRASRRAHNLLEFKIVYRLGGATCLYRLMRCVSGGAWSWITWNVRERGTAKCFAQAWDSDERKREPVE